MWMIVLGSSVRIVASVKMESTVLAVTVEKVSLEKDVKQILMNVMQSSVKTREPVRMELIVILALVQVATKGPNVSSHYSFSFKLKYFQI